MPTTYEKNKKHIYAWRAKNIETLRELNRNSGRKLRSWRKVQREFLNILLD